MVDSIVGQANMIRSILGLPERELVEDTSQEEGMSMVWLYCKQQMDIMVFLLPLARRLGSTFEFYLRVIQLEMFLFNIANTFSDSRHVDATRSTLT